MHTEIEKPFEGVDLDLIGNLRNALDKLYSTAQEMQDLITDNKGIGYTLEDKIIALEEDLKNNQKEG
jgi:hypothetical protein